uniref:Uncharacterized protein n=1 Tax=Anguilla anguilla TaxID=7936 RepID=A0A0E9UFS0_ANGAN
MFVVTCTQINIHRTRLCTNFSSSRLTTAFRP